MSYDLGFSEEFFFAEGEPDDRSDLALNAKGQPVSVWSAICKMKEDEPLLWKKIAVLVFETEGRFLTEQMVMDKIRKTDSCSNLSVPVQVWIDSEGYNTILVWE